jgi:FAD binding domain
VDDPLSESNVIVVGSGAAGSMAAQTLVERGANVLMLDGGQRDERYAALVPEMPFVEIRRRDPEQHRFFLGDEFESVRFDELTTGVQLTPPRRFIIAQAERLLPRDAPDFVPMESLAYGGLGSGWGLHCGVYSSAELALASLPAGEMRDAYQVVADRIGISGSADDAQPFTFAHLQHVQPAAPLDPTMAWVASRYARVRHRLNDGFYYLGRPAMAALTQNKDGRRATELLDMDFYANAGGWAWRPPITVDSLRRGPNFSYAGNLMVTRFEERADAVVVTCIGVQDSVERHFSCRRLVLACGALGTARIALRAFATPNVRLPLLCNAYTYVPCIVPARIGRTMPDRNTGLVQLVLAHDAGGRHNDVALASFYTYRSLLLFRLLREMPLDVADSRTILRYLLSGMTIVGIDHPQSYSPGKELWLEPEASSPTLDRLHIAYALGDRERVTYDQRERAFMRVLRRLGAWPIRRMRPPLGSSIHYAGTLPFREREKPFTLSPEGRLRGTRSVFVADASGFTHLPAKGLTLSLMANAHRIARNVVENAK